MCLVISPSLFEELVVPLLGDSGVLSTPPIVPPDVPGVPVVTEKVERAHSWNCLSYETANVDLN